MAAPNHPTDRTNQPAGTTGDGLDTYPTYRDAGTSPHTATATKPTDVNLPRSRRTFSLPMLLGVLAFGVVVLIYLFVGGFNVFRTAGDATSGDGTAGAPAASGTGEQTGAATEPPRENAGTLDEDVQPQTETGPGEVEATPGAIDVPGGDVAPVQTAPAQ